MIAPGRAEPSEPVLCETHTANGARARERSAGRLGGQLGRERKSGQLSLLLERRRQMPSSAGIPSGSARLGCVFCRARTTRAHRATQSARPSIIRPADNNSPLLRADRCWRRCWRRIKSLIHDGTCYGPVRVPFRPRSSWLPADARLAARSSQRIHNKRREFHGYDGRRAAK